MSSLYLACESLCSRPYPVPPCFSFVSASFSSTRFMHPQGARHNRSIRGITIPFNTGGCYLGWKGCAPYLAISYVSAYTKFAHLDWSAITCKPWSGSRCRKTNPKRLNNDAFEPVWLWVLSHKPQFGNACSLFLHTNTIMTSTEVRMQPQAFNESSSTSS